MLTKSCSLFLLSFFLTACSKDALPQPYTLEQSRSPACQEEITQTISSLIQAKNLTVSKDIFSKISSLHLNNQKNNILKKSPIYNDLRGRKMLMMYKKENALYIGLMNKKEEVIKEKELKKCF